MRFGHSHGGRCACGGGSKARVSRAQVRPRSAAVFPQAAVGAEAARWQHDVWSVGGELAPRRQRRAAQLRRPWRDPRIAGRIEKRRDQIHGSAVLATVKIGVAGSRPSPCAIT